jgi:SAM-dependent methyltransferase
VVGFRRDDSVLNIGRGPGHLEALLAPEVKRILAADTSDQFVATCRQRCRDFHNVRVARLGDDYTDLRVFGETFSLILCVSVVQYYRHGREVESLIASAKAVVRPGGRMLIADLPRPRGAPGFVWDALCSLGLAVREGHLRPLLHAACGRWTRASRYRNFQARNRELRFSRGELEALIRRARVRADGVRTSLSIYANRPGLLVHF